VISVLFAFLFGRAIPVRLSLRKSSDESESKPVKLFAESPSPAPDSICPRPRDLSAPGEN
jgi:hypothetical protein